MASESTWSPRAVQEPCAMIGGPAPRCYSRGPMKHVLCVALIAVAAPLAAVLPARAAVPTLTPDQVKPGQKATVRTVFEGQRVEEFDAEILGVLPGGKAGGDLILARATSERAIRTGVAQGMSGSPVYVDGKLIGALSTGWSFSREPVFGITPIGEMLEVLALPVTPTPAGTSGPSGIELGSGQDDIAYGPFRWQDPAAPTFDAGPTAPEAVGAAPLPVPLACAGLDPAALAIARAAFEPLGFHAVPGGRAISSLPPTELGPGSAVAVDLLRGDLDLSAIGTMTYRDGDRVLIFGHPLFQSGEVRLPFAPANITTVVGSQLSSFKIGSSGPPVGTLTQDRRAALAGTLGTRPRMMPVGVRVELPARAPQAFRFESIEDRSVAPLLVSIAAVNSLLELGGIGPGQTLRWTMRLYRRGAPTLEMGDVLASESPAGDLTPALTAPLRFLANNPYSPLTLDSIEVALTSSPGRALWTLRSARLVEAAVRPGGKARIACEIERWRGGRRTLLVDLEVPREAPDGHYTVWLGGAAELNRFEAARLPGRYRPSTLEEAWRRLAEVRRSDRLYVTLVAQAPEVTRGGRDYPELPASALALLASSQSAGDAARFGDRVLFDETAHPLDGPVRGELQIDLAVDSTAP